MKKFTLTLVVFALSMAANTASAHTTSLGFLPGENSGDVVFWAGTYDHYEFNCPEVPPANEGTLTVTGIEGTVYGPVELPFDIAATCTRPEGLVDGDNNCYYNSDDGGTSSYLDCSISDPSTGYWGFLETIAWQGVQISGLEPGTYSVTCGQNCGSTVTWQSFDNSDGNVRVVLEAEDVGLDYMSVPTLSETGKLAMLLLMVTAGMLVVRSRSI